MHLKIMFLLRMDSTANVCKKEIKSVKSDEIISVLSTFML
jgi:hypothetical protein